MKKSRSIRNRGKRKKIPVIDLDITSLLDILVIMLVFLLKSYDSSGVVLNIPKGVSLPVSESQSINTTGVIVQVSPTNIWVDDKLILDVNQLPRKYADHEGRRLIPLYDELVRKKDLVKQVHNSAQNAKEFSGVVNLVVDKTIKYDYLKKIMYTAAEAGFRKYKFVVLGEE
jgi:biopolymer transport protein ExbD